MSSEGGQSGVMESWDAYQEAHFNKTQVELLYRNECPSKHVA